jgi:4-amino-4-deoxy-L-arabinose transferase-like glycosyltransferase
MGRLDIEDWLTPRGVAAFWLIFAVAFTLMLWAVSPGRTLQDALEAEILQGHLAGGYQLRNPPLYEWLLWGVQQVAGPGPLSYLVLRYALIAATGILFYFAALDTTGESRVAAAFSFSLLLLFWFGWEAHHSVSHSLAILVAILALWLAAFAYTEQPSAGRALGLGLIIGLGIMAKWSFLLVVASLGIAFCLEPGTRRAFASPRALLILAGAVLPILPFALWAAAIEPELISTRVAVMQPEGATTRALIGVKDFLTGLPLVFLPWLVIVLPLAFRFRREGERAGTEARTATQIALIAAALSAGTMALILGAAILFGVRPFGIGAFAIHYLYPFALFATLGIAGLVAARIRPEGFARALARISLVVAVAIFVVKLGSFYVVPGRMGATHLMPYAGLAEALSARGLGEAQFVTLSPRDAGNLVIYLPKARALSPSARIEPPLPDPVSGRPCVLLWGGETSVPPGAPQPLSPKRARDPRLVSPKRLLDPLGVSPDPNAIEDVVVGWPPPVIGKTRASVWHLLRGGSAEEACRRFAVIGRL